MQCFGKPKFDGDKNLERKGKSCKETAKGVSEQCINTIWEKKQILKEKAILIEDFLIFLLKKKNSEKKKNWHMANPDWITPEDHHAV